MPLRFTASEKQLKPDARYGSKLVSKFVNCLMWDGKKTVAIRVFYDAMDEIHRKMGDKISPLEVFEQALDHVKPAVEIQSKRVGGATYQVPVRVEPKRQIALAMRWIIQASRGRKGRPMHLKLAEEFMAAFRREGEAVTKRENVHKMADANKAFAHFAH
ncbi:30S ribosomal protein S7 [bacterium]|nr:30S ribosomal protein S7 [bacterium]